MPTNSWIEQQAEYEELARRVCSVAKVTTKEHLFWRVAASFLAIVSFGRLKRSDFLRVFATTLGPLQAYPQEWTELSRTIIVHESRHTQQFLWAGWFVPVFGWLGSKVRVWVGVLPMAIVYGGFPLPIFLAWGRFRLELDAEAYAWRIGLAEGWLTEDQVRFRADWHARRVASWSYLRAWPESWALHAFGERAEAEISRQNQREKAT